EWEVEIEQLIISETLKQKQDLKNRQESLLSFLDEIKKPRTLSNSRDGRGKAVQLALQSLPQKKTANGDLNTISLLQIQPKIRKLPRLHIDLQNPKIISQRETSPLSSHSVSSSYLSQMSGSQSPSQLSRTISPGQVRTPSPLSIFKSIAIEQQYPQQVQHIESPKVVMIKNNMKNYQSQPLLPAKTWITNKS
ncbi:MAG: hypothetical protein EZS28_050389, partial [Streblomastix strix]